MNATVWKSSMRSDSTIIQSDMRYRCWRILGFVFFFSPNSIRQSDVGFGWLRYIFVRNAYLIYLAGHSLAQHQKQSERCVRLVWSMCPQSMRTACDANDADERK